MTCDCTSILQWGVLNVRIKQLVARCQNCQSPLAPQGGVQFALWYKESPNVDCTGPDTGNTSLLIILPFLCLPRSGNP